MADAGITLSAVDKTAAAFAAVKGRLDGLKSQASGVADSLSGVNAKIGSIGVALGAALAGASLKGVIDLADQLDDLSEKTGIAVQDLSGLRYAGETVGTPIEALATGIRKLSVNMAAAAGGSKESAAAFSTIGVAFKNLDGTLRNSDAVLADVADKFESFRDGPEKAALAIELFGKSGADMIPLLNKGAAGMRALRDEGEALGAVFGGDLATAAAQFNDNLKKIELAAQAGKLSIAQQLLPTLNTLAEAFVESQKGASSFATTIGDALATVTQAATVLAANVSYVLKATGREIGAIAAQAAALLRLDFSGFSAIGDAVKQDAERARREIDDLSNRILGLRNLSSEAGAGRGTAADPRVLGAVGSIASQAAALRQAAPIIQRPGAAVAESASPYEQINAALQKKLELQKAELAGARELREYEKFEIEALADILAKQDKLKAGEADRLRLVVANVRALMEENDVRARRLKSEQEYERQRAEMADEVAAAVVAESKAREASRLSIDEYIAGVRDSNGELELELRLMGQGERARQTALEQYRIELDLRRRIADVESNLAFDQQQRADEIARLTGAASLAKAAAATRAEFDEVQRVVGSIDSTARDVFINVFESGSDAFRRLGQTIKASVLDLLYQMTLRKWVLQISTAITGGGVGSIAQAGQAASGIGGLSNIGTIGSIGSSIGAFGSGVSAGFAGLTSGSSFANALTLGEFAAGGSSIAASIGTAVGYLGPIAIGIALLASLAKKGETRQGAGYSVVGGTATLGGGPSGGAINQTLETQLVQSTFDTINATLKDLGSKITVTAFEAGLESSGKGRGATFAGGTLSSGASFGQTYDPALYTQTLTPEQAVKQFEGDLNKSMLGAFAAAAGELPKYVQRELAKLPDIRTLDADRAKEAVAALAALPDTLLSKAGLSQQGMAQTLFDAFSGKGAEGVSAGQALAGSVLSGIQQTMVGGFASQLSSIVTQNILAPIISSVAAGGTLSAAMAEASFEEALAKAESAATAFAAVWDNPELHSALQRIAGSVQKIVDSASKVPTTPMATSSGTGAGTGANTFQSFLGFDPTAKPAGSYIGMSNEQIWSAENSNQPYPNVGATTTGKDLAAERQTLQDRLDAATLTSIQLREKERAAIDATNRDLFDQVTAAERAFGIEEQRKTLLDELNSLTDTHAQAIARQRNALDESLRSTFDAIQAERTLAEERQKLVSLADTAYGAADRFLEPASARAFKLEVLAYKAQLAGAGASVGELVAAFEALSEEGIKTLVQQLLLAPDLSLDAKNAILGIGTSLLDMADAATAATRPIGELIEQLTGTRAGLATPQQALQAARDAYQRDLSLAMGGDADALGRITARATEYLDAQKAFSASSDITQTVIDRVIGDLSGLQGSVGSAYGGAGFIAGGGLVSTSASAAGVGAGTDMLAELRGLRAETAQLRTELATLREQQAQSTTFLAAANASSDQAAAQTIVAGLSDGQSRRQFAIGVATVNRN